MRIRTPVGPIHIVGQLLEPADGRQRLRRRDGGITEFDPADVEAARTVPDPPSRRISAAELDRIGSLGWRPAQVAPLGDWLLRYAGGGTRRANSCLAVGDPRMPFDDAVAAVTTWYASRGLPAAIHVIAGDRNEPEFGRRGFASIQQIVVMTAEVGHVLRAAQPPAGAATGAGSPGVELRIDAEPDDDWLRIWRNSPTPVAAELRAVAVRHDNVAFLSLADAGTPVAIARISVDGRWGGLFAVAVHPAARGRGLGRAVTVAAIRAAGQRGARRMYLQVTTDNQVARALYRSLGFTDHHSYRYLAKP